MPSGIWHESEYAKLPGYDGDTGYQTMGVFNCHTQDGFICSGWLACHGPDELLAIRVGVLSGHVDLSVLDYTTDVPVWGSGAEAAEHGMCDIESPSERAVEAMLKVERLRGARAERTD